MGTSRSWKLFAAMAPIFVCNQALAETANVLTREAYGNWVAMQLSATEPSIVVTLTSVDKRAVFAIQCLTKIRRWNVSLVVPTAKLLRSGEFRLTLKEPGGAASTAQMRQQNENTLYAFFDSDKSAVFQVVRWFTIFPQLQASIGQTFPEAPLNFAFDTAGAAAATKIPLAHCSQQK